MIADKKTNSELINELIASRDALDEIISTEPSEEKVDAAVQRVLDAEAACFAAGMNLVTV